MIILKCFLANSTPGMLIVFEVISTGPNAPIEELLGKSFNVSHYFTDDATQAVEYMLNLPDEDDVLIKRNKPSQDSGIIAKGNIKMPKYEFAAKIRIGDIKVTPSVIEIK